MLRCVCHGLPRRGHRPSQRQGQTHAGRLLRRLWRLPARLPTGAITFEEREAAAYDEQAVLENKQKKAAAAAPEHSGCPGHQMHQFDRKPAQASAAGTAMPSSWASGPAKSSSCP